MRENINIACTVCKEKTYVLIRISEKAIPQLDTLLKVASALGCNLAVIPPTS